LTQHTGCLVASHSACNINSNIRQQSKSFEHAMRATWSCLSTIYIRHNEETSKRKRWFWPVQTSYHIPVKNVIIWLFCNWL